MPTEYHTVIQNESLRPEWSRQSTHFDAGRQGGKVVESRLASLLGLLPGQLVEKAENVTAKDIFETAKAYGS